MPRPPASGPRWWWWGDAGVGKTRLLAEFTGGLDAVVPRGGCLPLGATGLPFSPVVEVLRALTGEGGSTAGRTVVLVLEDLHWADRSTRQLLGFVAHNLRDQRLLVVAAYRAAGGRGRRC
jgi:hypothetical protein